MFKSLIVKALLLPAVAGGAYAYGHGDLPTPGSAPAPAAPAAVTPAPQAAVGGWEVTVTEDGPQGTPQAPQRAAQGHAPARAADPQTHTIVVQAQPAPATAPDATSDRWQPHGTDGQPQAVQSAPQAPAADPASSSPAATPTSVPPFANCAAVRASGKTSIRAGDPGWSPKLDRNHDGVACNR